MLDDTDDLDVLSSIWILACNDENPLITYDGVKFRLDLPADFDLLGLIRKRLQLYRDKKPYRGE